MTADTYSDDPLAGIHLLEDLSPEVRKEIAKTCTWLQFRARETVFDKDSGNTDVMFVVKGRVSVTSYSLAGKEVSFDEVQEGDHFGELSAIDQEPRSATIVTLAPSKLAALSAEKFDTLIASHPSVGRHVLKRFTRIIRKSNERIIDFATLSAQQRVCSEILRMAEPDQGTPGAWSVYPLPTQTVLASRIGTTRETVGRIISDLIRGGLLIKKGRSVFIPDREKMETVIERIGG